MSRYPYKLRSNGQPCRKVHLTYVLTESEEKDIARWAYRDGVTVRQWLEGALNHGVYSRILSASDEDDEEQREADRQRELQEA